MFSSLSVNDMLRSLLGNGFDLVAGLFVLWRNEWLADSGSCVCLCTVTGGAAAARSTV
jgi:hypothetical protein